MYYPHTGDPRKPLNVHPHAARGGFGTLGTMTDLGILLFRFECEYFPGITGWSRHAREWRVTASAGDDEGQVVEVRLHVVDLDKVGWSPSEHCSCPTPLQTSAEEYGGNLAELFSRHWLHRLDGEPIGQLAVLDTAIVHPAWRGRGLGPYAAAIALKELTHGPYSYAVCLPAPLEDHPTKTGDEAIAALARTWATLGFDHIGDGVWGLDLSTTALSTFLRKVGPDEP